MDDLNLTYALIIQLQLDDVDELHWRRSYEGRDAALVACGQNLRHAYEQWELSRTDDGEDSEGNTFPNMDIASGDLQSPDAPSSLASANSTSISRVSCDICAEDRNPGDVLIAPCLHEWCRQCVIRHFEASLKNESAFPPRCCQETIPILSAINFAYTSLVQDFNARAVELSTQNRIYCARPGCSAFVPPACISVDIGTCQLCGHRTCTHCKASFHGEQECLEDPNHQILLNLISENGWRRCYNCKMVVQRENGCNHMRYVLLQIRFIL